MSDDLERAAVKPHDTSLEDRVQALLAQGDARAAADAAIRQLGPSIRRFIRSSLRDEELAGDAFSSFAEDVVRALPAFRGAASLRTWAYRVAWHALLRVRDDAWQRRRLHLASGSQSAPARIETDTSAVRERRAQALDRLRSTLSFEDQTLLALRVDQGLSWIEIARVLSEDGSNVGRDALMKRFQRLKERLGDMIRREGLTRG